MNFERTEQLMEQQKAKFQSNQSIEKSLKAALMAAEQELASIDGNSREAFAIKGEIDQLKEAVSKNSAEYRQIIENNAKDMKDQLDKAKRELIDQNDAALKEKYESDLRSAVDRVLELKQGYQSDEQEFINQLYDDLSEFRRYDDGKHPSVDYLTSNIHSFGFAYVVSEQVNRINK
ncbi:hypothetical protein [Enterococcus sp. AZ007]|uniref:hypothetical protein n=1 Tax=Enterococcus sp. AZ007 TaxID=2774839 RepID=UPI003F244DDC